MKIDTNPYRAFARTVYRNLTELHYETVRDGQMVGRAKLEAEYDGTRVPKEVSVSIRGNQAVIETRSLSETDTTPNYNFPIVESLPKDVVVDAHIAAAEQNGGVLASDVTHPDELRDEEMVEQVYLALQFVLGMPDGEAVIL